MTQAGSCCSKVQHHPQEVLSSRPCLDMSLLPPLQLSKQGVQLQSFLQRLPNSSFIVAL